MSFSDLTGNAFSFSPLRMMLIVGCSHMAFLILRYTPEEEKTLPNYHTPHSIDTKELSGKPQHSFMIKVSTSQIQKGKISRYQKSSE